jgi:hypothetical protein
VELFQDVGRLANLKDLNARSICVIDLLIRQLLGNIQDSVTGTYSFNDIHETNQPEKPPINLSSDGFVFLRTKR